MGLACFLHGAGFTGSGERTLGSIAGVEATAEGRVRVLAASAEIGQGMRTVFAQIVADALGVDCGDVDAPMPDTAHVPDSGPTVASRTTMVVGKLIEDAALSLKQTLVDSGLLARDYSPTEFARAAALYVERFGALKCLSQYQEPPGIHWDDEHYRGDAYGTFAWAVYVTEVAVDMVTYQASVEDFVAVQEVGRVVNPALAGGQIEGGVAQGIGWALYEEVLWNKGRMTNNRMTNYIIPTAADLGPIRVFFDEKPYAYGPGGAKGLGELPMDGPAPAILNAIEDAIGVSLFEIPATPERILAALEARHA
jgi:CO/xanthine dehydrogenase Mo-binding subunit